ncbi:MAG: low molecular weight protein-tyrosine-phosphatase [Rhodospirillales bacterium]
MIQVLFVCTGNICRSPSGEGVLRRMIDDAGLSDRISVDSCGLEGWHIGKAPDDRSQAHALKRGYELGALRARKLSADDFRRFDYVIAMDSGHLRDLNRMKAATSATDIRMMMDYAGRPGTDVPDPYYDGPEAFELALDLIE